MKHINITTLANILIYTDEIGQGSHVDKDKFATRTGILEFEYRNHYICRYG